MGHHHINHCLSEEKTFQHQPADLPQMDSTINQIPTKLSFGKHHYHYQNCRHFAVAIAIAIAISIFIIIAKFLSSKFLKG